jgi:hypothetical protein
MDKFSKKMMGKEVGDAAFYAAPHHNPQMSGRPVPSGEKTKATRVNRPQPSTIAAADIGYKTDPNQMSAAESTPGGMPARRVSGGNPARDDVKTTGIKIRGTGAATKGVMARGPMA